MNFYPQYSITSLASRKPQKLGSVHYSNGTHSTAIPGRFRQRTRVTGLSLLLISKNCISQRNGLHIAPLSRIDNLTGQGLDLAIQAERKTAAGVSHLPDHYTNFKKQELPRLYILCDKVKS